MAKILPTRPKRTAPKKAVRKATTQAKKSTKKSSSKKSSSKKSSTKSAQQKVNAAARAAEKRAVAREKATKKDAGKRYRRQAATLEVQAKALQKALSTTYRKGLDQNLSDVGQVLEQQLNILKSGHAASLREFQTAAEDTEIATAGNAEGTLGNMVRERSEVMGEILTQGAGETDALKAMVSAARNWQSNTSDANRSYFDTMRSVNQGIVDLNVDTKSALANTSVQAEAEKENLWRNFYERKSESYTQLGNIRGQQADYYDMATEMGVKSGKKKKAAKADMKQSFNRASNFAGKSYDNPGIPEWIEEYEGAPPIAREKSNSNLAAATYVEGPQKAEGASLRKWAA